MKVRLDEVCNLYKGKTTITKAIQGKYPLVVTAENRASSNLIAKLYVSHLYLRQVMDMLV